MAVQELEDVEKILVSCFGSDVASSLNARPYLGPTESITAHLSYLHIHAVLLVEKSPGACTVPRVRSVQCRA